MVDFEEDNITDFQAVPLVNYGFEFHLDISKSNDLCVDMSSTTGRTNDT